MPGGETSCSNCYKFISIFNPQHNLISGFIYQVCHSSKIANINRHGKTPANLTDGLMLS